MAKRRSSAALLRVGIETAKRQAREAHEEIGGLKTRLSRTLVEEIATTHPEHSGSSATVKDLRAQIEQLLVSQSDLRRQLLDSEEELEAARRLNRTLIVSGTRARPSGSHERCRDAPSWPPLSLSRGRTPLPPRRRCEPWPGMIT